MSFYRCSCCTEYTCDASPKCNLCCFRRGFTFTGFPYAFQSDSFSAPQSDLYRVLYDRLACHQLFVFHQDDGFRALTLQSFTRDVSIWLPLSSIWSFRVFTACVAPRVFFDRRARVAVLPVFGPGTCPRPRPTCPPSPLNSSPLSPLFHDVSSEGSLLQVLC